MIPSLPGLASRMHVESLGNLFISSLPGKALRMLVESRGLPSNSMCVLEAKPSIVVFQLSNGGFCIEYTFEGYQANMQKMGFGLVSTFAK